jgi:hypothetical protein
MFLNATAVKTFIAELTFETQLITDILFAVSYDPSIQKCPVFKLAVSLQRSPPSIR